MREGYFLVVQTGAGTGQAYRLSDAGMTLGRYPLADIVIDAPDMSYRHAMITFSGDAYRIADLASDAGTYVNGRRIGAEPVELSPGDVILLGTHITLAFLRETDRPGQPEAAPPTVEYATEEIPATELAEPEPDHTEMGRSQAFEDAGPQLIGAEPSRAPIHPEPMPPMPPMQEANSRRMILITAGCLLLLGCCCSATLFMYFIGGDWLLNQLGLLP